MCAKRHRPVEPRNFANVSWSWLNETPQPGAPLAAVQTRHVYLYRLHDADGIDDISRWSQRCPALLVVLDDQQSALMTPALAAGATHCIFDDELTADSIARHANRCWSIKDAAAQRLDGDAAMQAVIGTSPIMLHRWRMDDKICIRFEYISQNISRFGYCSEEFLSGRVNWIDLMHSDDREKAREQFEQRIRDGSPDYRLRYRILTKKGEYRWVEDTAQIKLDSEGHTFFQGFILDVTERVADQQSLRRAINMAASSETRLTEQVQEQQTLLDNIDLGILILDGRSRIVGSNKLARSLWQLDEAFIATKPTAEQTIRHCFAHGVYDFPESELEAQILKRQQLYRRNDRQHSEIKRADGQIYRFNMTPLADGRRILTYYNITALKNAQVDLLSERKKLVENENRFRKLYNAANRNHKELLLLDKLQAAISNKLELKDLFNTAVNSISSIFGYDIVLIHVANGSESDHFAGVTEEPRTIHPLTTQIIDTVVRTGEPLLQHSPAATGDGDACESLSSILGIPLRSSSNSPAVLIVESVTAPLKHSDMLLMQKVAEQLKMARENVELLATVNSDLQRTRAMSTLSCDLNSVETVQSLYQLITSSSISIIEADAAAIYSFDSTGGFIPLHQSQDYRDYPGRENDNPLARAAASSEVTQAITPVGNTGTPIYDISLCVPLFHKSSIWGVLELRRYQHRRTFSLADETLLVGIGNQLSAVVHKQRLLAQIEHQAYHDSLTRLPNRRHFERCLETGIANARRHAQTLGILLIDLDGFKAVNDSLGHPTGDQMLVTLASRLQSQTRPGDTLSRMGGDEFAVILCGLESPDDALAVANEYLHLLNREVRIADHRLFVGASIGISNYPEDGTTALELLQHADSAMYQAKSEGKNIARKFSPALAAAASARLSMENDLNRAIENHQLELYYQPQVDCRSGQVLGVEALLRWNHPQRGLVPPMEFIPIAEETGSILAIGEWVLRQACEQNARWLERGFAPLRMAVNISATQFAQKDFVELVESTLDATGLPPKLLELEVTESVVMHDIDMVTAQLTRLQNLGVSIAIDDFGTGYSSLSYLQDLPLDSLKIDRAFINSLDCNAPDKSLANSIIMIAAAANLRTVAEGIESAEQIRTLAALGCSEAQGYLISKPQPAGRIEALLPGRTKRAAVAA
jgi:diguanylate cyclase (GGDEF)-like protein/PAS domain S-box-containing protein